MFKQKVFLEVEIRDKRAYRLECAENATLPELYEALSLMRNEVFQMLEKQHKEEKPKETEEKKEDE